MQFEFESPSSSNSSGGFSSGSGGRNGFSSSNSSDTPSSFGSDTTSTSTSSSSAPSSSGHGYSSGNNDGSGDSIPLARLVNLSLAHSSQQHGACGSGSGGGILPGPFVVMQGSPGDGMANTVDSMPVLPLELTTAATSGGGTTSRRSSVASAVQDRIPTSVLEELDSDVSEESGGDEPPSPSGTTTGTTAAGIETATSFEENDSEAKKTPRARAEQRRPRSDSDTEGGLHLPLGGPSSPIMRNAMNNFISHNRHGGGYNGSSPLRAAGGGVGSPLREVVARGLPLDISEGGDDNESEGSSTTSSNGGSNGGGGRSGSPFLKRRSNSQTKSSSNNCGGEAYIPASQRKGSKRRNTKNGNNKTTNSSNSTSSPGDSASDATSTNENSGEHQEEAEDRMANPTPSKSPAEIQAIHKWRQECTQQELTHLDEANDNVKLLIQRRKRTRDREAQRMHQTQSRMQQRSVMGAGGIVSGRNIGAGAGGDIGVSGRSIGGGRSSRSASPVGTATSASSSSSSSSSSDSVLLSSQPMANFASATSAARRNNATNNNAATVKEDKKGEEEPVDPLKNILHSLELAKSHRSWYQKDGRLVVFKSLPHMSLQGIVTHPVTSVAKKSASVSGLQSAVSEMGAAKSGREVMTLSPGCTVMAESVYILDSRTLRQIHPSTTKSMKESSSEALDSSSTCPQLVFLKITSPHPGYILSSIHSYPLLLPGLPTTYTNAHNWLWRVTCQPDGAYIRRGLELVTDHIGTLPYGTVCCVTKKVVNDMGLNRLKVEAYLKRDESEENNAGSGDSKEDDAADAFGMKKYSGYISEFLNPLSGQRGNVVEPLPFPVPALYKVIHPKGCIIRSGVELSTAQIGFAPTGSVLSIVGRSYSDHPGHNCIERLKLAGGGGWISVTLNKRPPENERLVSMVGVDGSFDPNDPAKFHFDSMRKVMEELHANNSNNGGGGNSGNHHGSGETRATFRRLSSYANLSEIGEDDALDQQQVGVPDLNQSGTVSGGGVSSALNISSSVPTLFRSGVVDGVGIGVGGPSSSTMLSSSGMASTMDAIRESSSDNHHNGSNPNRCLICLSDERTATIVHGETGHIACCLTCARILKARGDNCPVCRLPIDLVIQQFWA